MAEEKLDQSTATVDNGGQAGPALDNTPKDLTDVDLLAMDPEYQEMVEAEKKASGNTDDPPQSEEYKDDEDTGQDGDNKTDEIPPKEGDETPPVEDSEFEDDILPGLTGKQFESFEEPVKEIIAQTREALDVATEKATKAEERLNKLLNDPIVKHRESVIDGKNNTLPYKVPELNDATITEMQKLIDQDTPESKAKFNDMLKNHIKTATDIVANNARIQAKAEFDNALNLKDAGQKLVALAKLAKIKLPSDDPNVVINTDVSKLGDIGKVIDEIKQRSSRGIIGNPAKYLAEVDVEELYAQMAIKNKWPLLKNADKIIQEKVKQSNEKLFNKFIKGRSDEASGTLARGGQVDQRSAGIKTVKDGIDLVKLATDDKYHESILEQQQHGDWYRKVAELRQEGERMIEENPRLHASSNKNK
jgi:hypothetical protein